MQTRGSDWQQEATKRALVAQQERHAEAEASLATVAQGMSPPAAGSTAAPAPPASTHNPEGSPYDARDQHNGQTCSVP